MRGRGLKLIIWFHNIKHSIVAPHAGAWIETCNVQAGRPELARRPPCGGVD